MSFNLRRRHLSESQRAMVAATLATTPAHRPSGRASIEAVNHHTAASVLNVSHREQRHVVRDVERVVLSVEIERCHLIPVS